MISNSINGPAHVGGSLTPSQEQGEKQPERTLRQEEEDLDWSENLARSKRSRWALDLKIFVILLILSALFIVGLIYLVRGRL